MKEIILSQLILIVLLQVSHSSDDTCKVLALASCGDLGAYQAGGIRGIIDSASNSTAYDVVTGISTGAINAFLLSLFPQGQEIQATDFIKNIWLNLKANDFYESWALGWAEAFAVKSALYNSAKMKDWLSNQKGDKQFQRHAFVGTSCLNDGVFYTFEGTSVDSLQFINATQASVALTSYFLPIEFELNGNSLVFTDGKLRFSLDVGSGVNYCQGNLKKQKVDIDLVACFSTSPSTIDGTGYTSLQILMRDLSIQEWFNTNSDIDLAYQTYEDNPDVKFRYAVMPQTSPKDPLVNPFDYSSTQLTSQWNQGYEDGKLATQNKGLKRLDIKNEHHRNKIERMKKAKESFVKQLIYG